ncbi:MAG: hypothetical protein JW889_13775 [Verrucomicrobia bacterium]|nr:hypothetical protein [Verrucomicrobiota bacterium]
MRKKPNRSGSVSVQVIDKSSGYRMVTTIGSVRDPEQLRRLVKLGKMFITRRSKQFSLFPADQRHNAVIVDFIQTLQNASIRRIGPGLLFGQRWRAEKAFRISNKDLRIRPMYHRRRRRIGAHVLLAFVAYTTHKELDLRLNEADLPISPTRAAELMQTMYEMTFRLPNDPQPRRTLVQMDDEQQRLYDLLT